MDYLITAEKYHGQLDHPELLQMQLGISSSELASLQNLVIMLEWQRNYGKHSYDVQYHENAQVESDEQRQTYECPGSVEQSEPRGWDCQSANHEFHDVKDDCLPLYSRKDETVDQLVVKEVQLLCNSEGLETPIGESELDTEERNEQTGTLELGDVEIFEQNDEILTNVTRHPPEVDMKLSHEEGWVEKPLKPEEPSPNLEEENVKELLIPEMIKEIAGKPFCNSIDQNPLDHSLRFEEIIKKAGCNTDGQEYLKIKNFWESLEGEAANWENQLSREYATSLDFYKHRFLETFYTNSAWNSYLKKGNQDEGPNNNTLQPMLDVEKATKDDDGHLQVCKSEMTKEARLVEKKDAREVSVNHLGGRHEDQLESTERPPRDTTRKRRKFRPQRNHLGPPLIPLYLPDPKTDTKNGYRCRKPHEQKRNASRQAHEISKNRKGHLTNPPIRKPPYETLKKIRQEWVQKHPESKSPKEKSGRWRHKPPTNPIHKTTSGRKPEYLPTIKRCIGDPFPDNHSPPSMWAETMKRSQVSPEVDRGKRPSPPNLRPPRRKRKKKSKMVWVRKYPTLECLEKKPPGAERGREATVRGTHEGRLNRTRPNTTLFDGRLNNIPTSTLLRVLGARMGNTELHKTYEQMMRHTKHRKIIRPPVIRDWPPNTGPRTREYGRRNWATRDPPWNNNIQAISYVQGTRRDALSDIKIKDPGDRTPKKGRSAHQPI